jgi:hypothetical protein
VVIEPTVESTQSLAPVSVVIPCFRCAGTIDRAIASVFQQTWRPAEVILVEDDSGDNTLQHLHTLQAAYPEGWLQILALPQNVGAGTARNVGWDRGSQPYVAFLDADDYWLPHKVECQCAYMLSHSDITLSGHAHTIISETDVETAAEKIQTAAITPWSLLLSNPVVTPSVMVMRNIPFRFVPGKRHMEDHLLLMEIALSGARMVKLNVPLAVIGKSPYGVGGLSAQMWQMEKGDLQNYWYLQRTRRISFFTALLLSVVSLAKYVRRLMIVSMRRL